MARTRSSLSATDPVGLSRERVCREALALVDEEGLAALSMRRLGARLGFEAMSLYRHVRDKADLLDALHAAVLGDLAPEGAADPADWPANWRALLGGLARALRSALLRHPNVVPLFTRQPLRAPEARATVERARAALTRSGLSARDAEEAISVVGMFTIGHVLFETNGVPTDGPGGRGKESTFRFGLEALLEAIARRQARRTAPRRRPRK
jgi:AcrR family transcriptional regulator